MNILNRREFLKISALSACTLVVSTGLSGCNSSDDMIDNVVDDVIIDDKIVVSFDHGIASGDPLSDKVIIWTRVTTDEPSVELNYEVSTDESFADIIHNGSVKADGASD